MRSALVALLLPLLCSTVFAEPETEAAAERTPVVAQVKLTAVLSFEKPKILLREPAYFFFRVSNPGDKAIHIYVGGDYRNGTGRPDSFKVTAANENGATIPGIPAGWNAGGWVSAQEVPAHGVYTFQLLLPHWIKISRPGLITVVAKRQLKWFSEDPFRAKDKTKLESGTIDLEARTSVTVLPDDDAAMSLLIAEWGTSLLAKDDSREKAAQRLRSLKDARLAPYYRKLWGYPDYSRRFCALNGLVPYGDDASVNVLAQGLAPTVTDINLRRAAASSLSRNPNPRAMRVLLQHRADPEMGVRLTIVHFLGERKNADDVKMLKEYLQDADPVIRKEAQRYLDLEKAAD